MRKFALAVFAALLIATGALAITTSGDAQTPRPPHDFVLFDGTNPGSDDGVRCGSRAPYEIMGSFRAINGDATLKVTFNDGDFVKYPVPDDTAFSFTQAAGANENDLRVIITQDTTDSDGETTNGKLVGWLSASRHSGDNRVICREN